MSDPTVRLHKDGTVAEWSESAEALYGYPADEALGKHFSEICSVGPMSDGAAQFNEALNGHRVENARAIHRTRDGRFLNVIVTLDPVVSTDREIECVDLRVSPSTDADQHEEQRLWTWAAVETAVEGIITIDDHGMIEYANPAAETLFGYPREDLIGTTVNNLMPMPFRDEHDAYLNRYLNTGDKKIIGIGREVVGKRKDDSVFPMHLAVSEVQIGERRLFTGFIYDITERKSSEEKMHRLSSRFEAILAAVPDIVVEIDTDKKMTWINQAGSNFYGEGCIGKTGSDYFVGPQDTGRYLDSLLSDGEDVVYVESRQLRDDGEARMLAWWYRALKDESGQVTGALSTARDITEENLAKEEKDLLLRELNKRNQEINCLYRIGEVMHPGGADSTAFHHATNIIHSAISHSSRSGTRLEIDESIYRCDDFQETPWALSADIVVSDRIRGKVSIFFVAELDMEGDEGLESERNLLDAVASLISEGIERSEAEAKVVHASKLASVGELAAGVGHEINNPVNGIMNCADIILKESTEGSTVHNFAQLIRSESDRIATIVHNLLTFSRQGKEQHSAAQIKDIFDAVLSLCNKKIENSHIQLNVDVSENLPRIYCRSERLQQVFMNLVINSMHALDERYPDGDADKILSITAVEHESEGAPMLRITIEDHGTGIADAHLDRMFDPFFTTKGRDKGTGLGLSISDGIVRDHGGRIECETQQGAYTRFHVDLPVGFDGPTMTQRSSEALKNESPQGSVHE